VLTSCGTRGETPFEYNKNHINLILYESEPGSELVYSRVIKKSETTGEIISDTSFGTMDNALYQRVARPYTHFGPEEPYIYHSIAMETRDTDGGRLTVYKVFRQPNLSPVVAQNISGPPRVSERLMDMVEQRISSESPEQQTIEVSIKLRNVPIYDIPLKPRVAATGTAEEIQVRASRETAKNTREQAILALAEPVTSSITSSDGTVLDVMKDIGWLRARVTIEGLSSLMARDDIALITGVEAGTVNNACDRGTELLCPQVSTANNSSLPGHSPYEFEWYLGDGTLPTRMDGDRFYNSGYSGEGYKLGVIEYDEAMDDEGFFTEGPSGPRETKYRCRRECYLWLFGLCVHWDPICPQYSNFSEADEGYHGTMTTSIAAGAYWDSVINNPLYPNGLPLGDTCFVSDPNDQSHCSEFYWRTRGMAPNSQVFFTKIKDDYDYVTSAAYQKAIDDELDVLNLSHGQDYTQRDSKCQLSIQESYEEVLENAYDEGIFVVNSTGNWNDKYHTEYGDTKDTCLVNSRASKPKVFAVGGILTAVYNYETFDPILNPSRHDTWETGYTSAMYPVWPDDYQLMRVKPNGAQTGGADVKINNVSYDRAVSVVDLVAPGQVFRASTAGVDENTPATVDGIGLNSSGATPHVSGLAVVVKNWLMSIGHTWISYPGNLFTVMLAMGDRARYNPISHSFSQTLDGSADTNHFGKIRYGFGRTKLRLLTNVQGISPGTSQFMWAAYGVTTSFPSTYYRRLFLNGLTDTVPGVELLKCVYHQTEDMSNKSSTDQVSHFFFEVQIYSASIKTNGYCPSSPTGYTPIHSRIDNSADTKKIVAIRDHEIIGYDTRYWPPKPIYLDLENTCAYVKLHKQHVTSEGTVARFFCYFAGVNDNEN